MKTNDITNLWAPWRIGYLRDLEEKDKLPPEAKGCFLCHYWNHPEDDKKNLVLWRTKRCMVVFNRYPYTGGHMLIVPSDHVPDLDSLDDATLLELMHLTRDVKKVLTQAIHPHGFNMGINFNRCAGAGLPDHVHIHLVPRWDGDTNFMSVTGDVRVISQGLDDLYDELTTLSKEMNLPAISAK